MPAILLFDRSLVGYAPGCVPALLFTEFAPMRPSPRQAVILFALFCSVSAVPPAAAKAPAWSAETAILAAKSICPRIIQGLLWNARLFGDKWEVRGQGRVKGHPAVAIVSIPVEREAPLGCSVQVSFPDRTLIE